MLLLLVLFGLLLTAFGTFFHRRDRKVIGGTFAVAGGLLMLLAMVAFIIGLLSFHP
jgi:hypothetical protein